MVDIPFAIGEERGSPPVLEKKPWQRQTKGDESRADRATDDQTQ